MISTQQKISGSQFFNKSKEFNMKIAKNYKPSFHSLFLIGTGIVVLSLFLMFFIHGSFLFLFFAGVYLANWSGKQEELIKWNKGICKDTGTPWEFSERLEYTETADYRFYAGSGETYRVFYAGIDLRYYDEYKGKTEFEI
jgi:hypothetical protein